MTREEAIKHLEEWKECIAIAYRRQVIDMAIEALEQKPRLVSRWIDADLDPNFAKCKKCSEHKVDIAYRKDFIKQERWNFCPYCGAKMDKE